MTRPKFLEPNGAINAQLVCEALSLVAQQAPRLEIVARWSSMEMLIVYDWAIREHLAASDGQPNCRERPYLVREAIGRYPAAVLDRAVNSTPVCRCGHSRLVHGRYGCRAMHMMVADGSHVGLADGSHVRLCMCEEYEP